MFFLGSGEEGNHIFFYLGDNNFFLGVYFFGHKLRLYDVSSTETEVRGV